MSGNVGIERDDISQEQETEAIAMQSNLLDESDGEETEQSQTTQLNDLCIGSDAVDKRDGQHLGSDAVRNRADLHLGSDAVATRAGHQRNYSSKQKRWIIVAVVILAIIIATSITLLIVLTQNPDNLEMEADDITERCNVNYGISYNVTQVWTMTRFGFYQSLKENMVDHGILVYMNCTDGYDLKNSDGETINMANDTCINGALSMPFTCQPKGCNVNDVIQYNVSQVWTLTKDGLYQSLNESILEHGMLVFLNCIDGYDLRNNDGKTLNVLMAHGKCIKGTLNLPFTCEPICLHGGKYLKDELCECSLPYYGSKCEKASYSYNGFKQEEGICEWPYYGTACDEGCFNDGKYLEDGSCECSRLYVGAKCEKVRCFNGAKFSEDGTCECTMPYYGTHCEKVYTDCYDIHKHTDKPTGIYTVAPRGSDKTIEVKCDMDVNGGGWTVFQYRHDGSVDFYKKFDAYENGFGSLTGEYWLGLQYIHVMTSSVPSVMRIDVAAADGTQAYQTYDDFYISEGPDYKLNIGATSGTAGDDGGGLSYNKGQSFTTYDRDRDGDSGNCAELIHGAWWYSSQCSFVNLNGEYPTPGTTSTIESGWGGMIYNVFKGMESLKSSQIMFRRT